MACSKSKIEYLTHVWNFYPGCEHTPEVFPCADKCWARGMAHRYGRSFEPHLIPEKLLDPLKLKKPARIGVNFTGDTFGEWVNPAQMVDDKSGYADATLGFIVKDIMRRCPQHQFLFLTKRPDRLKLWQPFPKNAWVGASACSYSMTVWACHELSKIQAKTKFISFEPLMDFTPWPTLEGVLKSSGISWVIIGGWSGGKNPPKIEWVREIIDAADQAGIPVWLKDNLLPIMPNDIDWAWADKGEYFKLRQELPEVKHG
jgi:protein gp37